MCLVQAAVGGLNGILALPGTLPAQAAAAPLANAQFTFYSGHQNQIPYPSIVPAAQGAVDDGHAALTADTPNAHTGAAQAEPGARKNSRSARRKAAKRRAKRLGLAPYTSAGEQTNCVFYCVSGVVGLCQ